MGRFFRSNDQPEDRRGPPNWRGLPKGRRVLVEHRDPLSRGILERRLRASGYRAVSCAGPAGPGKKVSCPLLRQEPCPAVEGADAIVSGLDFRHDHNRLIAARIARARPDCPLFLDTPDNVADEWGTSIDHEPVYRMTAPGVIRKLDAIFAESSES